MTSEYIRDTWRTPRWLFDALHERYRFTIDAAASRDNALWPRYWTREDDALSQSWAGERAWCNPPYSRGNDVGAWLRKGQEAELAVYVLPVRTDTEWFAWAIEHAHSITMIGGRVDFVPPTGVYGSGNFERTMIVVMSRFPRREPCRLQWVARESLGGPRCKPRKGGAK